MNRSIAARAGQRESRLIAVLFAVLTGLLIGGATSSPGQLSPPGDPDAARLLSAAGRVSLERGADLWAISSGDLVNEGQVIITGRDGTAELGLPDGSHVQVFPNSRVIYRANHFNLRDFLDIYLGKVRFEIQHILPGETPLRVTSPTAVISVRGTVFEVEVDAAEDTTVSVDSGAVSVRHRLMPGGEVMVEAGQSLRVVPTLPLTASVKSTFPIRSVGRMVRAVVDTLAQIRTVRDASGGHAGGSPSGGGVSGSDSGSNQTKPPDGGDKPDSGSSSGSGGGSSSGPSAPPGDVIP